MKLRPFFYYYGGKYRAAPRYPSPKYRTIVEPFAGAAGYSTWHYQRQVILYDANPMIVALWNYLIHVKPAELLSLPVGIQHVDEAIGACQEAKWLIGFYFNQASATPHYQPSSWCKSGLRPNSYWGEAVRNRLAESVEFIRHWKCEEKSYDQIDFAGKATWFVDPPYSNDAGKSYPKQVASYEDLAIWCRSRQGQTIVCEHDGADWLPFRFLAAVKSNSGKYGKTHSKEAVWTNESTDDVPKRRVIVRAKFL